MLKLICWTKQKYVVTSPVRIPPKGEQTPLAALTADLPIEAVTGIEPTNDPASWQAPNAKISWEVSILCPGATKNKIFPI